MQMTLLFYYNWTHYKLLESLLHLNKYAFYLHFSVYVCTFLLSMMAQLHIFFNEQNNSILVFVD